MSSLLLPRRYSVLYFKRTNKVHKFRGTTREDGVLIVNPPPSCACRLVSSVANNDEDDDDEDDDGGEDDEGTKKGTMKKRAYATYKKGATKKKNSSSSTVWSGVNPDLSRRAHSLLTPGDNYTGVKCTIDVDDTLVLNGQWECVIVSSLNDDDGDGFLTKKAMTTSVGMSNSSMKRGPLTCPGNGGAVVSSSTLPRAPLGSLHKKITAGAKPLVSTATSIGLRKGLGTVGDPRKTLESTASRTTTTTTTLSASKPPTRVSLESSSHEDDNENDEDDEKDVVLERERIRRAGMLQKFGGSKSKTKALSSLTSSSTTTLAASRPPPPSKVAIKSDRNSSAVVSSNSGLDDFPGAKGERINVPSFVRGILRPHQRNGIAALWNCVTGVNEGIREAFATAAANAKVADSFDEIDDDDDDDGNDKKACGGVPSTVEDIPRGVVLADEMGLGKTLMTISTIYSYHKLHRDRRFIVVCPSTLVSNWSKEFDKWLGKASQPKRIVVRNGAESEGLRNLKSFVPLKPNQSEVLILSYELFRLHVKVIQTAPKIGILVVDEGHRLKNASGSQILTALNSMTSVESRILISGTPIQNNLSEFWNVANFAIPGILGDLAAFRRIYERPMSQSNQKNASAVQKEKGRRQAAALDSITSTFVIRRLQKDILNKYLKKRTEVLLFCRPTESQCTLYQSIANRAYTKTTGGRDECNNPLTLLTELRKLCTHPALLLNDNKKVEDASLSGKLIVLGNLLDLIRRFNPTDKVVIISNFTSALTIIEELILHTKGLSFVRLDGSTDNKLRGSIVDSFNRGSVDTSFAFLLSSKAGGCGLNLIGANRLIMVDADWNPATDHQAMARIYREGQMKSCFIYRLFTAGTVEEVIYQRQLHKGNLAKLANDGGSSTSDASFSKEELRDCFTLKRDCKCDTKRKLGKKWCDFNVDGCEDKPLLHICEDPNVTFVREVDDVDAESTVLVDSAADDDVDGDHYLSDDADDMLPDSQRSSSEEEEFDG